MVRKIVDFLGSIRLALFLLLIFAVISTIGIIIPQGLPAQSYLQRWGAVSGKMLLVIGADRVFSTPWFMVLLSVLALNILVCSLTRLLKTVRRSLQPHFLLGKEKAGSLKYSSSSFIAQKSGPEAQRVLTAILRKHFFRCVVRNDGGTGQIWARKGISNDIGALVFHLSLILLLIGGVVGKMAGYSYHQELYQEQVEKVRDRTFSVRNDWFKLETNPKGEVADYKTRLTILDSRGKTLVSKTIEVNDPLSYDGVRFYQSSYGKEPKRVKDLRLWIKGPGTTTPFEGEFALGVPQKIPGTDFQVLATEFLPDFIIDMASRTAYSRSAEHNNPAVRIVFLGPERDTLLKQWAFQKHPDVHSSQTSYQAGFIDYQPMMYTGIQIRKDPGVPLIWIGIVLMTLGLYFVFYTAKRNLWVFVETRGENESLITIGGTSSQQSGFGSEWNRICRALEHSVR